MAKFRSPVLGFNHNVRHLGWLFHVQTEDSGVQNPHIFTHLFHDGVILATKKIDYDCESDVDVVKGLMQAQHKSVLRQLKGAVYDDKIRQYLGTAQGDGAAGTQGSDPNAISLSDDSALSQQLAQLTPGWAPKAPSDRADHSDAFQRLGGSPPPPLTSPALPSAWIHARPGTQERPFDRLAAMPAAPHGVPVPALTPPHPVASPSPAVRPQASSAVPIHTIHPETSHGIPRPAVPPQRPRPPDGVVVSRPAVIVGAPPTVIGAPTSATVPPRRNTRAREAVAPPPAENIFGKDLISEKSLDEVIMAYLSEDSPEE